MLSRIGLTAIALIIVVSLLMSACSFFTSSEERSSATPVSTGEAATPSPLPPGLDDLLGVNPTPVPVTPSVKVTPEDLKRVQEIINHIREEVTNSYQGVVVTSATTVEFSDGMAIGYVVMFAVPDYFFNPQTIAQEQSAEEFQLKVRQALVDLLKKTTNKVASDVKGVKVIEIVAIYPDATGISLAANAESLLALPDDASKARWLGMLSATPLKLMPLDEDVKK